MEKSISGIHLHPTQRFPIALHQDIIIMLIIILILLEDMLMQA